jgi:hypothetical protein
MRNVPLHAIARGLTTGICAVGLALSGCGSSTDNKPSKSSGEKPLHLINSSRYRGKLWRVYGHVCTGDRVCIAHNDAVLGSGGAVLDPKSTKFGIPGVDIADFSGDYLNDDTVRTFTVEVGIAPEAIHEVVFSTPLRRFGASAGHVNGLPGRYFSYVVPGGGAGGDHKAYKREGSTLFITLTPARR